MNLSGFRHIVWDWNGTLLNDAWLCVDVMNGLLRRRGLPLLTPERYEQVFDFPVIDYYRRLGFDFEKEPFAKSGAEFIADYERRRHEAALQPEALDVLRAIRDAGIAQSVLSAYRHETLEELLRHFGVRDFFDEVVGADDKYAHGKVGQGRALIERLGLSPDVVAVIGDTVHDFEVSREIGCACFLIPSGNHSRGRLESCGVPVLTSLKNLL
jgi:phosphoglycolate phosphatase